MDPLGPASPRIDVALFDIIRKAEDLDNAIKLIIDQNWSGYSGLLAKDYFPDVCGDWDAEVDFAHAVIGILDALDAAGAPERQHWDPLQRAEVREFEGIVRRFLERIGWEWALQPSRSEHASTRLNKFKDEVEFPLLESSFVLYRDSDDIDIIRAVQGQADLAIERRIDPKMTLEGARTKHAELIRRQQLGLLSIFTDNRVETSSAYFRSLSLSLGIFRNLLPTSPEPVDQPRPQPDDPGIQDDREQIEIGRRVSRS